MPAKSSSPGFGVHESCGDCGAPMAPDQRYCVDCGRRRAPFVAGAATAESPDTSSSPVPPPPPSRSRGPMTWNGGAVLVGVAAVLILAMGLGVVIGQAGSSGGTAKVEVIPVPGGGSLTPEDPHGLKKEPKSNSNPPGAKGEASPGKKPTSPKGNGEEHLPHEEASPPPSAEITNPVVPQANPKAKFGETCEAGTAGCGPNHKFEGEFFPE